MSLADADSPRIYRFYYYFQSRWVHWPPVGSLKKNTKIDYFRSCSWLGCRLRIHTSLIQHIDGEIPTRTLQTRARSLQKVRDQVIKPITLRLCRTWSSQPMMTKKTFVVHGSQLIQRKYKLLKPVYHRKQYSSLQY